MGPPVRFFVGNEKLAEGGIWSMSDVVYCLNVFRREKQLRETIDKVNEMFNSPPIYVASNGIQTMSDLTSNVTFNWFGSNQGWQLGALNGCCQALRMAAEHEIELRGKAIIFSHDDVYPANVNRISELIEQIGQYDLVCRKYVGPHEQPHKYPYIMIESIILSPRVLPLFLDIPKFDCLPHHCAEMSFGKIATDLNFNILSLDVDRGSECEENETGFYHDHKH